MKKLFTPILIVGITISAYAQQIKDKSSLKSISNAIIQLDDSSKIEANTKGKFDLSDISKSKSITIKAIGYFPLVVETSTLSKESVLFLEEKAYETEEVVVSASKFEEKQSDVPQQTMIIKSKDLEYMNAQTSGDVLQQSGNVYVQKSQLGGGSPILRGYEANKVLIVVDGVRMNNAIYRGGHLQNVITLDNNALDRVEVVYGPGSVIYGSDALGGVMHFHTKKPKLSTDGNVQTTGGSFYRYSTANKEETYNVNLNVGFKNFASFTSYTNSKFGDLRTGANRDEKYGNWGKRLFYTQRINGKDSMVANSDPNVQIGSGYTQEDVLQKFLLKTGNFTHIANIQYSTSSNVPRYDRLTDINSKTGKFNSAEWYYGPQNRLFTSYTLEYKPENTTFFNQARLIFGNQNIDESRISRNFGSTSLNSNIENVKMSTINLDFNKNVGKHEIRYGVERVKNDVTSTANTYDIVTTLTKTRATRYPDGGSKFNTTALYLTHTAELSKKFIITEGIRYCNYDLTVNFKNGIAGFSYPYGTVKQSSSAINGNLGVVYQPGFDWRFAVLGSSGFRAPNVDDFAKVFESSGTTLILPNPDLKPEYNYNLELSASKVIAKMVKLDVTAYNTWAVDAIVNLKSKFNGQDSVMNGNTKAQVFTNQNAQTARINGINGQIAVDITHYLQLTSAINYTKARAKIEGNEIPLDHIPPLFGKTSVIAKFKKFKGELWAQYSGEKKSADFSPSGEDNKQYSADVVNGFVPAWFTLNLRTAYNFNSNVQLQASLDNIFDKHYRLFASGISAPGRNLSLTLRANF